MVQSPDFVLGFVGTRMLGPCSLALSLRLQRGDTFSCLFLIKSSYRDSKASTFHFSRSVLLVHKSLLIWELRKCPLQRKSGLMLNTTNSICKKHRALEVG